MPKKQKEKVVVISATMLNEIQVRGTIERWSEAKNGHYEKQLVLEDGRILSDWPKKIWLATKLFRFHSIKEVGDTEVSKEGKEIIKVVAIYK
jgi:hypothetical protein